MKKYLLLALAVVVMAGCEKYPVYEDVHIGDYYFEDGTISSSLGTKILIGVVFEVNEDNTGGSVVCLDETQAQWSMEGKVVNVSGAESTDNGQANMTDVMAHDTTYAKYPAFAWVHAKNPSNTTYADGKKGVWYFPSINELRELYKAVETVNTQLGTVSGATLLNTNSENSIFYWSSTERSDFDIYARYLDSRDGYGDYFLKDKDYRVRAIIAF